MCVCVLCFVVVGTASDPLELIKQANSISTTSKSSVIKTVTEEQPQYHCLSDTSAHNNSSKSETNTCTLSCLT